MLSELIRSFILIFFAEMGDKTQIIAMTFATKYKVKDVLFGVILGIALNHGIAIVIGRVFSNIIPMNYIQILAGIVFIIFAYLSLLEEEEDDEEENKISNYGPIITVAIAFFVGELGDKSQLTAMTLSAEATYPIIILLGTVSAMTVTSAMGIVVGSYLGNKIPDLAIKIVSSIVFYIFGVLKLIEKLAINNLFLLVSLLTIIEVYLIVKIIIKRKNMEYSKMQLVAQELFEQTKEIKNSIESICLGQDNCGNCSGKNCFVGYVRSILNEARENNNYKLDEEVDMEYFIKKEINKEKVLEALILIIETSTEYNWPKEEDFVINKIIDYLEEYLFSVKIESEIGTKEYIDECKSIDYNLGEYIENSLDIIK